MKQKIVKQMELTLLLAQQSNCSPSSYTTRDVLRETIQNGEELALSHDFSKMVLLVNVLRILISMNYKKKHNTCTCPITPKLKKKYHNKLIL